MAKKDPKDLSVEDKLKHLYQLQTTLSAIDEKRALRGELPLEVRDLEDEIAGLNTRIDKIRYEIDDFQRAISQREYKNARIVWLIPKKFWKIVTEPSKKNVLNSTKLCRKHARKRTT